MNEHGSRHPPGQHGPGYAPATGPGGPGGPGGQGRVGRMGRAGWAGWEGPGGPGGQDRVGRVGRAACGSAPAVAVLAARTAVASGLRLSGAAASGLRSGRAGPGGLRPGCWVILLGGAEQTGGGGAAERGWTPVEVSLVRVGGAAVRGLRGGAWAEGWSVGGAAERGLPVPSVDPMSQGNRRQGSGSMGVRAGARCVAGEGSITLEWDECQWVWTRRRPRRVCLRGLLGW